MRLASGRRGVGRGESDVGGFDDAKNISPQCSRRRPRAVLHLRSSGRLEHLPAGDRQRTTTTQVTNLLTGVSGITRTEPGAVRVARAAWSSAPTKTTATPSTRSTRNADGRRAGGAAAAQRRRAGRRARLGEGPVFAALSNPDAGLPPPVTEEAVSDYKPKMTLDFAGQPAVGVGFGPLGTYAAGGVSFLFSDMLGQPRARHVGAGERPVRRDRRVALLSESHAPLELGRVDRSHSLRGARIRGWRRPRRTAGGSTSNASCGSCSAISGTAA